MTKKESKTQYANMVGKGLMPFEYCSARTCDLLSYVGYKEKKAGYRAWTKQKIVTHMTLFPPFAWL
ncbi:hypothetical protein RRF57_000144 [Xylaria bambusicola]|uniref:Uncharacterized protein n=1 Tax=Xylaria bambusicola TaxID=326684 RepID=A0AAN7Z288_9PEZI